MRPLSTTFAVRMRRNGYLWTSGVNLDTAVRIRRPQFPVRVQNFGDLATFSVDFCVLYAKCPPYFYFRFVSPTGLESIPHASTPTSIIPTKFEVDMTTHWRFIAFLSVDTSRDLVTLNSGHAWRVTWLTLPPSLKTLRLFVHELRVITVPTDYHWKCTTDRISLRCQKNKWRGLVNYRRTLLLSSAK